MTYILFISAVLAGLFLKKSKWVSMYILGVMFVLAVYKYNCADLGVYQNEYILIKNGSVQGLKYLGQYLLTKFCTDMGMSFENYLMIYYTFALGFLYVAIKKMTKNVNWILACYMIYSFGIDAIQMKTMLTDAMILLAFTFLFNAKIEKNKKEKKIIFLKFCILAGIATTIHFMAVYFWVIGIIYYAFDSEKIKDYMIYFVIIMSVVSVFDILPQILTILSQYISIFDVAYVNKWLVRRTRWGWLIPAGAICLMHFCNTYVTGISYRNVNESIKRMEKEIRFFNYSVWCILPLLLYSVELARFFRVYVILLAVVLSNLEGNKLKISNKILIEKLSFYILLVYLFFCEIYHVFESTLGAMLKYNTLFN